VQSRIHARLPVVARQYADVFENGREEKLFNKLLTE